MNFEKETSLINLNTVLGISTCFCIPNEPSRARLFPSIQVYDRYHVDIWIRSIRTFTSTANILETPSTNVNFVEVE